MPINLKNINTINYINFTMKEVNECTDNIYEAMMDSDYPTLQKNIEKLNLLLSEIKKTHKTERV